MTLLKYPCAAALLLPLAAIADETSVPLTRAEMKAAVQKQKEAAPRLPLPPGDRPRGNNGSMQNYYLPAEWRGSQRAPTPPGAAANPGAAASKDGRGRGPLGDYGTELFWIVSRANDCRYCMGHQEVKLASVGYSDDRIAALDGDWTGIAPADRAGLAYARKITLEPHLGVAAELEALVMLMPPAKALAIVASTAGNNRTNRWTGPLNITQDREPFGKKDSLDGGISPQFANLRTKIAPAAAIVRPPLEPRAEAERRMAEAATRTPHPLLSAAPKLPGLPAWTRVVATAAADAESQVRQREALFAVGVLPSLLRTKIQWVCARHDRAWTALADARRRLRKLGLSDDAIFALDAAATRAAEDRAALALAEKITVVPQFIADADFAPLRGPFQDKGIAEIVYAAAAGNWFDRITEPLAIPAEEQ